MPGLPARDTPASIADNIVISTQISPAIKGITITPPMPFSPAAIHQRSASGIMLLVLALLFAQWLGLAHRIEHAGLQQTAMQAQARQAAAQANAGFDKSLDHSCALFDAAALATALNSPAAIPTLLPGTQVLALWVAFASWDAPFLCHFSPRAPPPA
jgi:hypothetical protein